MITTNYLTKSVLFIAGMLFFNLAALVAGEMKMGSDGAAGNTIVIKDFMFNPQKLTVKSGETITWINRDEEPHTVVSVEKQFKKSPALDTDQKYSITAGAPGTYSYFCSVHPKMTGTIIVEKP